MANQEPIVFDDITPIEVPVSIGGESYVLREASGEASCRYNNARSNCTKFVSGEFAGVSGPIADAEPRLVADCLFKISRTADGKAIYSKVEEKTVRSWPARVQRALFQRAKEISRLDETDEETAEKLRERLAKIEEERAEPKNSLSDTPAGSP